MTATATSVVTQANPEVTTTTTETKTAEQIAADAAAAVVTKTPEQIATEKAATEAAAATAKTAADAKALADAEALIKGSRKVPETYTLTLPEGDRLTAAHLEQVSALAKAKGWTNEEAQAAVNEHAAAIDAQSTHFLETTKADKDYGGDKLPATLKLAKTALEKLRPAGTPRGDALRQLLDTSGYGNHIEVVSLLADLGRLMAEDSPSLSSGGAGASKDPAAVLYGGTGS